ncbi:TetR family transcriptional regulator [Actinomadura nitritigenes]|uniref:TetR family transcriptional regulator n=1 Tax=Actinomadura nitritigenes TaxID=134602 RepID=UPI003D8CB20F
MPRPRQPLISRTGAVAAAIEIIDTEGLDALSLPRLARHLDVRAPSLYHHFDDKSEILGAVVAAIVADTVVPRKPPPERWVDWFVQLSLNLRRVVLRHRNAAPLLLQYPPRDLLADLYEDAARFLEASGVPAEVHVQILDSMDTLVLGAVISEAARTPAARRAIFPNVDAERQPTLARALERNEFTANQLFEEMIRSFLHGVLLLAGQRTASADTASADAAEAVAPS